MGLEPCGTVYILLESVKKKIITFDEFLALMHQLSLEWFRLSEEVYTSSVEEARRREKERDYKSKRERI
ncbi:hypothetical protein HYX14_04975 [Candidatus Woesearchaeota archaeon]|nr:hypothetical protein [Candidatus Woesearchaeota archaeon]